MPNILIVNIWQKLCYTFNSQHLAKLMKVKYQDSLLFKIEQRIASLEGEVVLFNDVADLADKTQISRALRRLVKQNKLIKLGYGVFAKAYYSERLNKPMINANFSTIMREALTKLNIEWELGKAEQDYNEGRSTQVPAFASVKLKSRLRRNLAWENKKLRYE